MKFQIKHRFTAAALFEAETENLRLAVELAVKSGANLSGANLSGADLSGADLSRANLFGADLYGANLYGANLSRANLSGANLYGANLSRANLFGANLYGANLSRANLSGANLYGADLYGADLSRANLYGANLSGANLYGAGGLNKYLSTPIQMLRDQPGKIRSYKLTKASGEGPYNGGITYEIGKSYEVADANTDETIQCAEGINLATLDWCLREWKEGYRILIAEFKAADIAAIPIGSDGKFRVFRCTIVGEKNLKELDWPPQKPDGK